MAVCTGTTQINPAFSITKATGTPGAGTVSNAAPAAVSYANAASGANSIDLLYLNTLSLAAAAQTLDLTALTDSFGVAVNFVRVRSVTIVHKGTTDAQPLTIGVAASNPWTAFLGGTTPTVIIPPGGRFHIEGPLTTGMVTSGGSKSLKFDPGANTFTVDVIIAGCSA